MMKKYLKLLLTSVAIVPIIAQTTSNLNTEKYQQKQTKQLLQTNHEWEKYTKINGSDGVNWKALSDITNQDIDSMTNQTNGLKLTNQAVQVMKGSIHDNIAKFKKRNLTLQQTTNALMNSSDNIKNAAQHPEQDYTNQDDKITAQFFGYQKVDLQLDGLQTYQTAINNLQAKINQLYPNSHWKLQLHDQSMANQTLFDDSSQTNITRFVDNQNSMAVDAQWGNGKSQTFNVQLANVMLNPALDQTQLFDAVTSYFNGASRFDLNLSVNNTLGQAVTAYCQKIADRFKINVTTNSNQSNPHDKFTIVLADNPNQTILSTFKLNDIFSQNMHLNLSIFDYYASQQTQSTFKNYRAGTFNITNVKYDLNLMKDTLTSVFASSASINHPQTLGLSTDDTLQTVIDKFNEHLNGLYSHDLYTFHSQLANPAEKDTTLATQYNPTLANNGFHVNTDMIFSYKGQDVNLGNFTINLGNVTLTGQCSKDQKKFVELSKAMEQITKFANISKCIEAISALATASLWAVAILDFGITTAEATAATVATLAIQSLVYFADLTILNFNNQLATWQKNFVIGNSIEAFIKLVTLAFPLIITIANITITAAEMITFVIMPVGTVEFKCDTILASDLIADFSA